MADYTITNGILTASFLRYGAELVSLKNAVGKEFIYRDTSVWNGSAPVLFPICGGLRDDKFVFDGTEYNLCKHGFARKSNFELEEKSDSSLTFLLHESAETLAVYPFCFEFRVRYTLVDDSLVVEFITTNTDQKDLYYSCGAHEAYVCPGGIEKYSIVFDKPETLESHFVRGVTVDHETYPVLKNEEVLPLRYSDYAVDALVFSKFRSRGVTLAANDGTRMVRVDFPDSTHLLLWTTNTQNAPYLCIEPWNGMPDYIDSEYDITERPGIRSLAPNESETITHTVTVIK